MICFAFPFQHFCVLVSVLKNEERFCITGYSTLNQRMSERNLMLNCSCSRIFCVLCTFGDQHNKVMFCMHICSHDKTCSFIEGYSTVKQGSAAFEESCTEVFCVRRFYMFTSAGAARGCCCLDTKYHWLLYWPCLSAVLDALTTWKDLFDSVGAE